MRMIATFLELRVVVGRSRTLAGRQNAVSGRPILIHTYYAVPLSCRSAKGLDCLSHLIYTVRPCFIHTYHAVPLPCHEYAVLKATSQGHGRVAAWERHGMCKLASAVQRRHVADLPAFGFFRLPLGVPGRLLSEA
jgi:hypothetical protein